MSRSPARKIFARGSQNQHSSTPKRRPIFSEQKHSTVKKTNMEDSQQAHQNITSTALFLHQMLQNVDNRSQLVKELERENQQLLLENEQLERASREVLKKMAAYSSIDKVKQKNAEYRSKLLKAESLLYELKASSKVPLKGLDQLILSLHI